MARKHNSKIKFDDDDGIDSSDEIVNEEKSTTRSKNKGNKGNTQNTNQKENGTGSQDAENLDLTSDSEEEDDDGLLHDSPTWHDTFLKLLPMIHTKDPQVFEKKKFFDSDEENKTTESTKKKDSQKPLYLADYLRNDLLNKDITKPNIYYADPNDKSAPSLAEETEDIKNQLLAAFTSNDETDILVPRKKSMQEVEKEEKDYQTFLEKHQPKEKELSDMEILEKFWKAKELDDNEKFLRDYILNQGWIHKKKEEIPTYQEIVQDDEEFSKAQNVFEEEYNKNNSIESYPRNIETSSRIDRNAEKRKKKREERKLKKELKMKSKEEELKKLKNVKKKEIIQKLKELEEITGSNVLENFDTEDFDPADFDKKMSEMFGDNFYDQDDTEKPVFEDDNQSETDDVNPDSQKEQQANQNSELKKEIENIIDEYYKLDYEDLVGGDVPTRFKYLEVPAEDFGLSPIDILTMDDDELNKVAPLKLIAPYRTGKRKFDAKKARANKYKLRKLHNDNSNNNNTETTTTTEIKSPKEKTEQAKIRKARITYRKKISNLKSKLPPSEVYRLDEINNMDLADLKSLHKTLLGLVSTNNKQN